MRRAHATCAAAVVLAAAPYLALTASDRTAAAHDGATGPNKVARCAGREGVVAEACASSAAKRREQGDETRPYVAATSTRLRHRAYLRAAVRYCDAYHGRVRSACFDEAAAMFGDGGVEARVR